MYDPSDIRGWRWKYKKKITKVEVMTAWAVRLQKWQKWQKWMMTDSSGALHPTWH